MGKPVFSGPGGNGKKGREKGGEGELLYVGPDFSSPGFSLEMMKGIS